QLGHVDPGRRCLRQCGGGARTARRTAEVGHLPRCVDHRREAECLDHAWHRPHPFLAATSTTQAIRSSTAWLSETGVPSDLGSGRWLMPSIAPASAHLRWIASTSTRLSTSVPPRATASTAAASAYAPQLELPATSRASQVEPAQIVGPTAQD